MDFLELRQVLLSYVGDLRDPLWGTELQTRGEVRQKPLLPTVMGLAGLNHPLSKQPISNIVEKAGWRGEFSAIRSLLYKRLSASPKELMSP